MYSYPFFSRISYLTHTFPLAQLCFSYPIYMGFLGLARPFQLYYCERKEKGGGKVPITVIVPNRPGIACCVIK